MSTVVSLDRSQHYLIDVRLDSLDRILMDSGVSRSERSEIVQAVEDQIFEMLEEQGEELSRESVLQILRTLDPPEAYCGEKAMPHLIEWSSLAARRATDFTSPRQPQQVTPPRQSVLAIVSFVLALVSIPTILVLPLGSVLGFVSLICALIALPSIAASNGQLRGRWMALVSCGVFALHFALGLVLIFFLISQ